MTDERELAARFIAQQAWPNRWENADVRMLTDHRAYADAAYRIALRRAHEASADVFFRLKEAKRTLDGKAAQGDG